VTKAWYKSRTGWINLAYLASVMLNAYFGVAEFTDEEVVGLLVIVNLILRTVTGEGLEGPELRGRLK